MILFRAKSWTSPSSSHDLFFCRSHCALFSRSLFVLLFNCLCQYIAKSFTQKLPLGGSGVLLRGTRAFCDAYALRGTCPQEGATHFSGHIYILYQCAWESRFQWFSLVWGSLRSPNYIFIHRKMHGTLCATY